MYQNVDVSMLSVAYNAYQFVLCCSDHHASFYEALICLDIYKRWNR